MYEYVRTGTTGQPVRAPHVPPVAAFKRSGGRKNLPSIAASGHRVVRGEDPAERGAELRCHRTHSDHHRGHGRSKHGATRFRFRAAADFPLEGYNAHINVKETFALH